MSKEEPAHVLNTGVGGGAKDNYGHSLQTFCKLEEKQLPGDRVQLTAGY